MRGIFLQSLKLRKLSMPTVLIGRPVWDVGVEGKWCAGTGLAKGGGVSPGMGI